MHRLTRPLRKLVPTISSITDIQSVGGGCISDAQHVTVRDETIGVRDLFVKSNHASFLDNFECEWDGLVRLNDPGVIGVPDPIAVGVVDGRSYLVTSWIDQHRADKDFFAKFGAALADLHRATLGTQIGLDHDNYLGSAQQINSTQPSWVEFFSINRLEFQLRWAVDQGLAAGSLQRDCGQIIQTMDQILAGRDDATSLLHGDLWSGNYLCGPDSRPVIIDPAVYYGCREAEFGMLKLFGSCPDSFYDAYNDRFSLPSGWQHRVGVYVLYHLLNHLNLFGSGYHSQCCSLATEILSDR